MKLTIVIPCFNEEKMIFETNSQLQNIIYDLVKENKISDKSGLLFVDDGSVDNTWNNIQEIKSNYENVKCLKLAKNAGHQNALLAGLLTAKLDNDIVISIDADLQDDIAVIPKMVEKHSNGFEIVYGVRQARDFDSVFKKQTALFFYKLMNFLGAQTIYNHADYRLMSKRSLDEFSKFEESNLFLRGLVPLLGFSTTTVYYQRKARFAGETKYPFIKMLNFALDGITSMSIKPLRLIFLSGITILVISFFMLFYILFSYFTGKTVAGWSSLILSIWFLGSIILIAIGVLGEYIGKIYTETKKRPRYIIEEYS
ncbi:glycosyltransferase [Flavobacterium sp.]|uniref:glycosyltransferase family 2 protein n=1 Tax=Flavobacterium sp. TaxID=239 RepID=UPI00286E1ED6|nr:glycosyltransferase [Flavobacterium sp.]